MSRVLRCTVTRAIVTTLLTGGLIAVGLGVPAASSMAGSAAHCIKPGLGRAQNNWRASGLVATMLGDSITSGYGVRTPWPDVFAARLGRATIHNYAVAGSMAWMQISHMNADLERIRRTQPDVVFIAFGTNEWFNQRDPFLFQRELDALTRYVRLAAANADVVFLHWTRPLLPDGTIGYARYGDAMRNVARDWGAQYLDFERSWSHRTGLISPDGIHPSDAGSVAIGSALAGWFTGC